MTFYELVDMIASGVTYDDMIIEKVIHGSLDFRLPVVHLSPRVLTKFSGISVFYNHQRIEIMTSKKLHTVMLSGDPVANSYLLSEMARFSAHESKPLHDNRGSRITEYLLHKNSPTYADLGDGVRLHRTSTPEETFYCTLDHGKGESLHHSLFQNHLSGERLPFNHMEQVAVERINHPKLDIGYATDVAYIHFTSSDLPLSSSDVQYRGGHSMWKRLAKRAFSDGHHVYQWDNESKTLTNLDTVDKINKGLESYINSSHDPGHIILSKTVLE